MEGDASRYRFLHRSAPPTSPASMILEGYRRYGKTEGVYRVPTPANWLYIITPNSLLDELKRPDVKVLSTDAALLEILSFDYIFDNQIKPLDYHIPLLVGPVTKNIGSIWIERTYRSTAIATEDLISHNQDKDDTLVQLMEESTHEIIDKSGNKLAGHQKKGEKNIISGRSRAVEKI
ncbi:hypothetical protein Clacol_007098 [Clathrus columnatus]|uniref:Uncharacterized protein n=1 Tax=Clathrus columnatus TaxID=1419009 RepID=A0AAV5AJJ6_9AGAM|nr:hypothetical protein Clacol_007098 [Clathrus columnatus]